MAEMALWVVVEENCNFTVSASANAVKCVERSDGLHDLLQCDTVMLAVCG